MKKGNISGHYLITHRNFIFSKSPEIFLILQNGDEIRGVCVNQPIKVNDGNDKVVDLTYSLLAETNDDYNHPLFESYRNFPVANGGPDDRQFHILHTLEEGETKSLPYLKGLYYSSTFVHFRSRAEHEANPHYSHLYLGYKKLDLLEIASNSLSGNWEVRTGLHFMAYGFNLERKIKYLHLLKAPKESNMKVNNFDVGGVANQLVSFMEEAVQSIMVAGIFGYLRKTTDLSKDEINDVTRAMLAVSEAESVQVNEVMQKYTHQEFMEKWKGIRERGLKLNHLEEYDTRCAALTDLGLDHTFYDYHAARHIFGLSSKSTRTGEKKPMGGRSKLLEKTLGGLARIIQGRRGP